MGARAVIIGTAGHIDHGKSALVTALTGRAVDRLVEERRRGITIDLNFAPLEIEGLPPAGIIDVPGHEDLVRTMVAGATGVDLVLLVIDLAEGPRPQTEEHLTILEQLRIPRGIPVFTKADLVEPDWADLVVAETMPRLARSRVRFEAPAVVSAVTGAGIAALRTRLAEAMAQAAARPVAATFRMPVDRTFSVAGVGTVVTGTAWSGTLSIGDVVRILPDGSEGRVRSLETFGRPSDQARPATRTALGLAGVDRDRAGRGQTVVTGVWKTSTVLDVSVELVASAPRGLAHRTRVRIHHGTAEVLARVSAPAPIEPGASGIVRLVLEKPMVVRGGDRLVLRSYSPVTTIGGGSVLDPFPPRRSRPGDTPVPDPPDERAAALVGRRRDGLPLEELAQLVGLDAPLDERALARSKLVLAGRRVVHRSAMAALRAALLAAIERHHAEHPAEAGLSLGTLRQQLRRPDEVTDVVLSELLRNGKVEVEQGLVSLVGFAPVLAGGEDGLERLVSFLEVRGLETPTADEIADALAITPIGGVLRRAIEVGRVVAIDRERYAARSAAAGFVETLRSFGSDHPITPATLRDRTGLTRKYLIPLLEWADRQGVTRREGEGRVLVQSGR